MCSLCYYHNRFVETHALTWYMVTSYAQVHELWQSHCGNNWMSTLLRAHCFHDCIYMYIYYNHLASVRFEHTVYIKVIYIYVYIYIYICNHEKNVSSQLSPQRLCGNSYTHMIYGYIICPTGWTNCYRHTVLMIAYIYIYITTILVLWD